LARRPGDPGHQARNSRPGTALVRSPFSMMGVPFTIT
jgi:hypothetical protein